MMADMPEKFLKPYDAKAVEPAVYKKWEDSGYFNPDNLPGERKESFSIVLPLQTSLARYMLTCLRGYFARHHHTI